MGNLLEPGEHLGYWLIKERFLGTWGVVYRIRKDHGDDDDPRPDEMIAKTLRPEFLTDENKITRFERECYTWLSLASYKHIVRLYTVDRFNGQAYALGEYISPRYFPNTLRQWIDYGLIEKELALRFGIHILYAISYARKQGVDIHQDLKPDNVMITPGGVAKVTDWGLSRLVPREKETIKAFSAMPYQNNNKQAASSNTYGSLGYAPPELYDLQSDPTPKVDMFSLAVILGEMLSGKRMTPDTSISDLKNILNGLGVQTEKRFASILSACLSSNPEKRPDSLDELKDVVGAAFKELTGVPIEKEPHPDHLSSSDQGQVAYALGMLGKLDEMLQSFKILQRDWKKPENKTGKKQKEIKDESPVVLMDLKEKGFVAVIPEKQIGDAERVVKDNPNDLEQVRLLAGMYSLSGDYQKAIDLFEQFLKHNPSNLESLEELAELALKQMNFNNALTYCDRYLRLKPNHSKMWLKKSVCYENLGKINDALMAAQQAAVHEPKNAEAHLKLGHYLTQLGRDAEAKKEFETCIKYDKKNALAWFNIATVELKTNDFVKALSALQKAVEIDPNLHQAYNTMGVIYMQTNLFQDALASFEKAISIEPHYARPWFNKGQIYQALGKRDLARKSFEKALEIDPGHQMARNALRELK